jgi:hypothetical protein
MKTFSSIKSSSKKRQAGQAAVEFALIIVFLVVFLMSFVEITALVYTYSAGRLRQGRRAVRNSARHLEHHLQWSGRSRNSLRRWGRRRERRCDHLCYWFLK